MPHDWGTTIVDAGGAFHDLAKNAFDAFSGSNSKPLNATVDIMKQSFSKTWEEFRETTSKEFGLSLDEGLSLESVGKQLMSGFAKQAIEFGVEAAGGVLLSKVAGIEGPIGILMSQIVTVGIAEFSKRFVRVSYKPGQWVILELEPLPVRINQKPHVIQVSEKTRLWGDSYIDLPDDIDYMETPHHSIGCIMGPGDSHAEWVVFIFEQGKESRMAEKKIRAAPDDLAKTLDKNREFSLVREVLFLKDHDPTLKSYVPTEPGDTVYYKKQEYLIIDTFDDEFIIEHTKNGTKIHVNVSELVGGERGNSSNWRKGHPNNNSFTSLSPDTIYSGQWVWMPAGKKFIDTVDLMVSRRRLKVAPAIKPDTEILGLVEFIDGKEVHLVRAFDGKKITEPLDLTRGVKKEVAEVLNHNKDAKKYKVAVLKGQNTETNPLGKYMHDMTLGIGAPDLTDADKMEPLMKQIREFKADTAIRQIAADRNALNAIKQPFQDRVDDDSKRNNKNRYSVGFGKFKDGSQPSPGNGSAMILLAGVVVFLALYAK